jgi:N-acetylglucosamine kinase-like BadF-type ATPase
MMSLLLAIDGGNSKTDALLFTADGDIAGELHGPGSGGGPAHFASVVREMCATQAASIDAGEIAFCAAAAAGVDFPDDERAFARSLQQVLPAARIEVTNDALALLNEFEAHDPAVVLVCGAGMNAVARGPAGVVTVPALDWISGDWGGGDAIGREAVRVAYRAADGRGVPTALERDVLRATGRADFPDLAMAIRDGLVGSAEISQLARVVGAAAEQGDAVSTRILARAADEAVALVRTVVGRAWNGAAHPRIPALLAGGLFRDRAFSALVERALCDAALEPRHIASRPLAAAVRAVCLLALGSSPHASGVATSVIGRIGRQRKEETA